MSNLNINRNNTNADKTNNYNEFAQRKADYRGIAVLAVSGGILYIVFWLLAIGIAALRCWTSNSYECNDTNYVFYIGLAIPIIILIGVLTPTLIQVVRNMSYRAMSGILLHRDDIRILAKDLLPLGIEHNKSLATTGAETYSPSYSDSHNGGNTTNSAAQITPETAIKLLDTKGKSTFEHLYTSRLINNSNESVLVGFDAEQMPHYIQWDVNPTVLIAGKSRQGKSNTVQFLLTQLALSGAKLFIGDLAGEHEQALHQRIAFLSDSIYKVAKSYDEVIALVKQVHSIGVKRHSGADTDRTPVVLVIDEFTKFMDNIDKKDKDEIVKLLRDFANSFGKFNVRVVLAAHNLNGNLFGDAALRRSITAKIFHLLDEKEVDIFTKDRTLQRKVASLSQGQVIIWTDIEITDKVIVPEMTADDIRDAKKRIKPCSINVNSDEFLTDMLLKYDRQTNLIPQNTVNIDSTSVCLDDTADLICFLKAQGKSVSEIRKLVKGDNNTISRIYDTC